MPECAAAGTAGVVSADGTQVSWGLGPGHKQGDAFDVVLTPAPGATAPFQAPFQEPTAQTFAPAAGLGAPPPAPFEGDTGLEFLDPPQPADAPVSDVPAFGPQPFDAPAFDAPAFDVPAFGVPGFNMPPFNAPAFNVPALEPPGGPDAPGDDMAALAPPGDQQGREVPVEAAAFSAERIVALVILGLLAVWLWHLSGVQEPQPRLIGGLARAGGASPNVPAHSRDVKPVLGGVGRFARQRARMPTRL